LNFSGSLLFESEDGAGAKTYFNFTGLTAPVTDTVVVYELTNHRRILTSRAGTSVGFLAPNSGSVKKLYLTSESAVTLVTSMQPVNAGGSSSYFIDYSNVLYDEVDYLIVTHSSLLSKANNYATYRNSTGYKSLVADVGLLYDEFAYGIGKHPLAITNFSRFARVQFADTIHGLFLMGKGYRAGDKYAYRQNSTYYGLTLVPSFGNPPSDNLFTSEQEDNDFAPAIPTGRLAARTPTAVDWYLEKMQDYEVEQHKPYNPANPNELQWMKRVLHFAGGSEYSQMITLLNMLNKFRDTLMAPYFGADV